MSAVADRPAQPSMRRMREFAVRPDRELGQNFLVDSNILGVIGRAAELERSDVVLEIGGGLGVLSEYLAERVAHVHVVEVDERLRDALLDATGPHANVTVHWGDAMRIDLGALHPRPSKLVANLPYGIAAGVLLRTVEELPTVSRRVAMAQREAGIVPRYSRHGSSLPDRDLGFRILDAIALQRPQIIRVAQLGTQRLEDRPVPLASRAAKFALQVIAEVVLYSVIVE